MGMFYTVMVPCPSCGKRTEFQSKGGDCDLNEYELEDAPADVLSDINRHSPYTCSCGTVFAVNVHTVAAPVIYAQCTCHAEPMERDGNPGLRLIQCPVCAAER